MYTYVIKNFENLSNLELFNIIKLRQQIFIVEQNCIYTDLDNKDLVSYHVLMFNKDNNTLMAYARLIPEGVSYDNFTSIGRVCVLPEFRKSNVGKNLMNYCINQSIELFHKKYPIKISAQIQALSFYSKLNFIATGNTYLEDGLPHIQMIYHIN